MVLPLGHGSRQFSSEVTDFYNVWFKLGVVHTPLAIFSLFSIFLVKSRLRGFLHPYGISLLIWYHPYGISLLSIGRGEIPRISKEGSEIPRAPEGGMYDAKFEPHITHFTFQKILPKGKIFGNVQNRSIIGKKGVLKNCIFWAICEEVCKKCTPPGWKVVPNR